MGGLRSVLQRCWRRLRQELHDLLQFVLIPGLAAVLPWPVCFALFRWLAHWRWLYRADCDAALAQAVARGHCQDTVAWAWERRLVTLVDHADHYLFCWRPDRWMQRHVAVHGAWQGAGSAGLLWTFHWGAGLWALRHAWAAGMRAHMVLAPPLGPDFAGRSVFGRYVRARMRSVHRALERPVIFVPGARAALRGALQGGAQVVAVMDVPQDQVRVTRVTEILGQGVSVPAVLPQMAVEQGLPVTVFCMGIDLRTGRRVLHVEPLGVFDDPKALTDAAFERFGRLLATAPAAWHLWGQAERFFAVRDDEA